MTANIFSDSDVCMACERPLKGSDALYCNDICQARDGQPKQPITGLRPDTSPSIKTFLHGVQASQASQSSGSTAFGASGHPPTTYTSTSTVSFRSATSSPLQSPSPCAAPEEASVSPQEDTFHLPPPAYPTATVGFSPGLSPSSHPVKIPASLRGLPPAIPYLATLDLAHSGAQPLMDSTLHYGRRPGVTNSITSSLALSPVGCSCSRLRELNDKLVRPVPNALGLSPLKQDWSLHGTGSLTVNVSNGESYRTHHQTAHEVENQTTGSFNYGASSPPIVATTRRRAATSAVDASEAQGSLIFAASTIGGSADPLSSSVRKVNVITPLGSELVVNVDGTIKAVNASYFERRRSFPLQRYAPRMSLTAQAALKKPSATATSGIEDDLHISDADDEDGRRGRGRSREQRDTSVARREMSSSDQDRLSSAGSSRGES